MTLRDLKQELEKLGDSDYIISYNEGYKAGGFVIDTFSGIWRIRFIDERGNEENEREFKSEDELCNTVLKERECFHKSKRKSNPVTFQTPNVILL